MGILFFFILAVIGAGYILKEYDRIPLFLFGLHILLISIILSRFLKLEASNLLPVLFPVISLVIIVILVVVFGIHEGKSAYISYNATVALAFTVAFLSFQFQGRKILLLALSLLFLFHFYMVLLIGLPSPDDMKILYTKCFYWGIISAIFMPHWQINTAILGVSSSY